MTQISSIRWTTYTVARNTFLCSHCLVNWFSYVPPTFVLYMLMQLFVKKYPLFQESDAIFWDYTWVFRIVFDFHCIGTVFGLCTDQFRPGADRAGSLVEIVLPWLLLFWTTGKGLCLSRPTTPPQPPHSLLLLPWLAWSVYLESFSPGQLHFSLSYPNGHHVTFF